MKQQLVHISVHQTALVVGILYAFVVLVTVLLALPFFLAMDDRGAFHALGFVFVYPFIAYIGAAVAAWLYNRIAARFGGVEFTLRPSGVVDADPDGTGPGTPI